MSQAEEFKWTRAVWMEGDDEEEGTILTKWVQGEFVRWPVKINALRALSEGRSPNKNWLKFDLVKLKCCSNDRHTCEDFNFTTDADDCNSPPKYKHEPNKVTGYENKIKTLSQSHSSVRRRNSDKDNCTSPPKNNVLEPKVSGRKSYVTTPPPPHLSDKRKSSRKEFNFPKSSSPDISKRKLVVEDPKYSSPDKKKRKLVLEDASILRSHQLSASVDFSSSSSSELLSPVKNQVFSNNSTDTMSISVASFQRFQSKVFENFIVLKEMIKSLGQRYEKDDSPFFIEQLTEIEKFKEFDDTLSENDKKMCFLSRFENCGGATCHEYVRNIMNKVMSNGVMSEYNLNGKFNKLSFRKTNTMKLIVATVAKLKKYTEKDVENSIGVTLKHAPLRKGGVKNLRNDDS
ncbi:uncharacterized protein LOC124809006 isoform X3 [Hydra vulgaris]|uniref:uncharacterized protein LOC124809006 isoform X3 n=1 Tax=Hydra vulgaris TaxID=6087 RepID=UPI001F5E48B3|nr:uncharacterized protein LOC124809006 isoform X4 [Hydra vulgaris]